MHRLSMCVLLCLSGALPAVAADPCTGVCQYCALWSQQRGCARCAVDEQCLKTLKSPKLKYKRVPVPELRSVPKVVVPN